LNACPLCRNNQILAEYHQDKHRTYVQCSRCKLVIVPEEYLLTEEQEKAQYDHHQNDPTDKAYQKFLSRTFEPLILKISKILTKAEGLDFGCGSGPTISVMAEALGIKVSNYDLYYFNHPELLTKQYDFITMTEVIEHIAQADNLLQLLDGLLKPNSILAVMTKRVIDKEHFKQWHYKNDPTHIRFYSVQTFQWIAQQFNWQLEIIDQDVVFFIKNKQH